MQGVLNSELSGQPQSLFEQFNSAEPFRHVLIRDFLAGAFLESVSEHFPKPVEEEMLSEFGDRSLKHTVEDLAALGGPFPHGMLCSNPESSSVGWKPSAVYPILFLIPLMWALGRTITSLVSHWTCTSTSIVIR